MGQKVLIIGGVAGGASTAARLRRNDESVQIIMFEKGEYISFANCGLPYYIGGSIEERSALLVQTPKAMKDRFNIDVRVQNEVLSINKEGKTVSVKNHISGETYEESYDVLVLSPGSLPLRPPIPGIDSPNIFSLWNIPDTDAVKGYVDTLKPKRAAIIGGGFIGLEMAENLHDLGIEVTVVEMANQVMAPIDYEMAAIVQNHMRNKNVQLYLEDGVKSFAYNEGVTTITLQSGKTVEADMVMLSIGIRPQGELAKAAGLAMNERGGIVVNDYLLTSDPSIYALGDAIEVTDFMTHQKAMVPLAGPANKQGRIVANNICGQKEKYHGTQGTAIAKVFDLAVASTGMNEKTLKRLGKEIGKDYQVSIIHSKSHAGYYPGSTMMAFKLIFELDGKVLGAQIVGYGGVDKRIDVIATALRYGGTVQDLTELELAYAPPYSSAKDPVNMVAFSAENILLGKTGVAQYYEAVGFDKEKTVLVDVRDLKERERGFIEGSVHIPVNDLRERHGELDKSKDILLYCAIGLRGYIGARILKENGFENVRNLSGGYTTYSSVYCGPENSKDLNCVNCIGVPKEVADFNESGEAK
jgi:NADPH-dependent 2,4-dienoyl-CoA reductase/sulfur reductase-like enzyme/rhodanese-related sulfurtransferase